MSTNDAPSSATRAGGFAADFTLTAVGCFGRRPDDDDVTTSSNGGASSDDEMSADDFDDEDQPPTAKHWRNRSCSPPPKLFPELLEHCRRHRLRISKIVGQWSFSNFTIAHRSMAGCTRIYCLGRFGDSAENSILYVDLSDEAENARSATQNVTLNKSLFWKLLKEPEKNAEAQAVMSKEEELLRQRLRLLVGGISSYIYHEATSTFLFSSAGQLYTLTDSDCFEHPSLEKLDQPKQPLGSPMDAQFCPCNPSLISCVLNDDLYLQYGSHLQRLTISGTGKNKVKTAGVASYIIQEEFDRFTGYWWCPVVKNDKYYILCEENDATNVEVLNINCPAELADNVEVMRYPKPGKPNVKWNVALLEISVCSLTPQPNQAIVSKVLSCVYNLRELFPWAEYMVRAGWAPDGSGILLQLMSRLQRKVAVIFVPLNFFVPRENSDLSVHPIGKVTVLYEEDTPDLLIRDHNYFVILDQSANGSKNFLWSSSETGFSHLYTVESRAVDENQKITASDQCLSDRLSFYRTKKSNLTSGEWEICRLAEPFVDKEREIVFFVGFKDSAIESHIYCVSYHEDGHSSPPYIQRLTELGFSYGAARDPKPFRVSSCGTFLISTRSSLSTVGECLVYALNYDGPGVHKGLPRPSLLYSLCPGSPELPAQVGNANLAPKLVEAMAQDEVEHAPEILTYQSKKSGFLHYACLWRPANFRRHRLYPTILCVYAGPEVQLVKNSYLGGMNVVKYTSLGYAVLMIDSRGSANRGLNFERAIWNQLGTVELDDQVEGLRYVSEMTRCLDLTRVALIGWSYGGYIALMGLAKMGDVFKMSIAGAPVTSWEFYDTGYTERFMGLPPAASTVDPSQPQPPYLPSDDHYRASSVLQYARQLPDQPGRLLLLHGLMDENVHFCHTAQLIDALLKCGKPYAAQFYPQERHALRNFDTVVHMEATVLDFLQRNL